MPRALIAGVALQFLIMPFAGAAIAWAVGLQGALAAGLILVACCPGGTASNVVAYLARGNVALSVAMTMTSTLLAVALTPLLTGELAGAYVEIDRWNLLRNMLAIVLLPVIAGTVLNTLFPQAARKVSSILPLIAILLVVLIVGAIIGGSKDLIREHAGQLVLATFMLHVIGFGLGYVIARLLGFGSAERRAISIEVGMQNSGLGSALAKTDGFQAQFADPLQAALAPVPSAISSVWHVIIGSVLAGYWRRRDDGGLSKNAER